MKSACIALAVAVMLCASVGLAKVPGLMTGSMSVVYQGTYPMKGGLVDSYRLWYEATPVAAAFDFSAWGQLYQVWLQGRSTISTVTVDQAADLPMDPRGETHFLFAASDLVFYVQRPDEDNDLRFGFTTTPEDGWIEGIGTQLMCIGALAKERFASPFDLANIAVPQDTTFGFRCSLASGEGDIVQMQEDGIRYDTAGVFQGATPLPGSPRLGPGRLLNLAPRIDLPGTVVEVLWDLDNDGIFDDASGTSLDLSYDYLVQLLGAAPEICMIHYQATDSWGNVVFGDGQVSLIPEPATMGLLAFCAGLLLRRRRSPRR